MSNYRKTMTEALREMYSLDESVIDKVKEIASKKAAKKIDGVMVDSFTASAISQIYDKVNDANKKKMEKLPITKLANLAFKMMQKNEFVPEEVELDEDIATMAMAVMGLNAAALLPVLFMSVREIIRGTPLESSIKKIVDKLKKNKNYKMSDSEKSDVKGFVSKVKKDKPSLLQKAMKKIKEEVDLDEASARADARRSMRADPDMRQKFSKDVSATDDDIKGASKNIMMQMRKAQSLKGRFDVEFNDGKKIKIPVKVAVAVQQKFNSMRKPADKEKFQSKVAKSYKDMLRALKEEVELDEAKYEIYHKDFSSAMKHAYKAAKKMYGITVDPKEIDDKVASGPRKPSSGKTNSYRLKGDKGAIQVQVYNMDNKKYELNMYKEEVELDEKVISLAKGMGKEVVNDGGEIKLMKGGKVISSGDYDRGAGVFFMNVKGKKGQVSFKEPKDILGIKEEVELDEVIAMTDEDLTNMYNQTVRLMRKGMSQKQALKQQAKYVGATRKETAKVKQMLDKAGFKEEVELLNKINAKIQERKNG
jgi:hypothetical protein